MYRISYEKNRLNSSYIADLTRADSVNSIA